MEKLVTTLETSKKLKAAGFPQKAYWYWLYGIDESGDAVLCDGDLNEYEIRIGDPQERAESEYAAPTAQEIADQLPRHHVYAKPYLDGKLYSATGTDTKTQVFGQNTMAEALALLWLKLQEVK